MDNERRAKVRELLLEEKWDTARAVLERADEASRDVEWLALMAEVEAGEGESERALELYQRVLDERPRNPAALYNRALVLVDLERYEDAVSDLEDLIEVEGQHEDALALLAESYLGAEFLVPAWLCAARWEAIAEDDPTRWSARSLLARALDALGRRDDALAALDDALSRWLTPCDERAEAEELRGEIDERAP
jgi:tetratricopeptide (TPR) repeat protein